MSGNNSNSNSAIGTSLVLLYICLNHGLGVDGKTRAMQVPIELWIVQRSDNNQQKYLNFGDNLGLDSMLAFV